MSKEKISSLEKSLTKLGRKGKEGIKKVDTLNNLAFEYHRSDLEKTKEYAGKARDLAQQIEYPRGFALSHTMFSLYYMGTGDYDKGIECSLKALKLFEEIGDQKGIASSCRSLGNIYLDRGDFDQALKRYEQSLGICEQIGDKGGAGTSYNNVGLVFHKRGDLKKALNFFDKALKIRKEAGDKRWVASTLNNIGNVFIDQEKYEDALDYQERALQYRQEYDDKQGIAFSYNDIGLIHLKQRRYEQARDCFEKGLKLAHKIGGKNLQMGFYNQLTDLFEAKADFKAALDYNRKAAVLKEELFSEESAEKITQLRIRLETEQKAKEAEIYRLKNVELVQMVTERTSELEAEIAERKRAEKIQSVLLNISQSVTKSDTLKDLLRTIHMELGRLMETVNFYVALYNEVDDTYTFPYEVDEAEEGESYTPQQLKKSLTDYVRRTGHAVLVDEAEHMRLTRAGEVELVGTPSPSWMGAPLMVGQRVIGVVVLQSYNENALYTHNDLELFNYVAGSIALGIVHKKAEEELKEKLAVIKKQQESILELSTPVIKIWEGVVVIPLVGVLDSRRAQHLTEELVTSIAAIQSQIAILDITGVPTVDSAVANHLVKTIESVKLLGTECVITGIRPEVAQTIVHLGIDMAKLDTRATLAEGLKWAFTRLEAS